MRWALGLGVALFLVQGEAIEAIIDSGDELLESSQLPLLLQDHGVESFEVVLQVHQQRLDVFQRPLVVHHSESCGRWR